MFKIQILGYEIIISKVNELQKESRVSINIIKKYRSEIEKIRKNI